MLPRELKNYLDAKNDLDLLDGYITLFADEDRIKYSKLVDRQFPQSENYIVIGKTAFCDILIWDGSHILLFKPFDNEVAVILSGFGFFFDNILDVEYQKDYFELDFYTQAVDKLGRLDCGECFIFNPIRALGGEKTIDNISKGNAEVYLQFLLDCI
jgi:hypothetical protein